MMKTIAAITGSIGGLCAVMGIVTALEVIDPIKPQLTMMFWLVISVILFLSAITMLLGRGSELD
jgi:hypothetical protein